MSPRQRIHFQRGTWAYDSSTILPPGRDTNGTPFGRIAQKAAFPCGACSIGPCDCCARSSWHVFTAGEIFRQTKHTRGSRRMRRKREKKRLRESTPFRCGLPAVRLLLKPRGIPISLLTCPELWYSTGRRTDSLFLRGNLGLPTETFYRTISNAIVSALPHKQLPLAANVAEVGA